MAKSGGLVVRQPEGARVYLWSITIFALGVIAAGARAGPSSPAPDVTLAVGLIFLAVVAQHFPLEVSPQHKIDVSMAVYVMAVLSFSAAEAVTLVGASQAVGQVTLALRRNPATGRRRRGLRGILFNTAQLSIATWLAATVYAWLGFSQPIAIAAAALVMYLANFAAVEMMVVLQSGSIAGRELVSELVQQLPDFGALCMIGIVTAFATRQTSIAVWLMVVPTAAVHVLQRRAVLNANAERLARVEAEQARAHMRLLATSSLALAASLDYEKTLDLVARLGVPAIADWCLVSIHLHDLAHADRVVNHINASLGDIGRRLATEYPCDPHATVGVARVLASGRAEFYPDVPDSLLVAAARDTAHLALLRAMGIQCAMVVPLRASDRTFGAISYYSSNRHYGPADLALAEDMARRCALAVENARLYDEQHAMVAHLRQLSERLGAAEREQLLVDERHRIAYELHDRVEQTFFGIGLNISAALDRGRDTPVEGLRKSLAEVRNMAALGVDDLRAAIFALTRAEIHDRELVSVLSRLVRRFQQNTGLEADLVVSGPALRVAPEIGEVLLAVAREGLANVEQHARASAVILNLRFEPEAVTLTVRDDGVGAPSLVLSALAQSATRFGIRGIRDRVTRLGGTLIAEPGEDGGFITRARIPMG